MTIALATMVKNESAVIVRMLTSVRLLIDRVIMLDTGSTDNTIDIARQWCKDYKIPFDLLEHPFDNFGDSRSRLLAFAKGKADWIFMLDADWTIELTGRERELVIDDPYLEPEGKMISAADMIRRRLDPKNASYSLQHGDVVKYTQPHFIRGDRDWTYVGAVHEYLARSEASILLSGLRVVNHPCDPATRAARVRRNLLLLLAEYAKDPTNSRTVFYLGRTYNEMGNRQEASIWFRHRVAMGGWDEETFIALCEIAYAKSPSDPLNFWEAWSFRPTRAEPLFWLARAYHLRGEFNKAKQVDDIRRDIPIPKDILFVDTAAYGPDANPFA